MKHKSYTWMLKQSGEEPGSGTAVFSTLNVIDRDGDVTTPGAFGNQTAKLVEAHDWASPSIGLAKVSEQGNEAVADFKFNLDMPSGAEWYKSLKFNFENGIEQQFSYGFDILEEAFEQREGRRVRLLKRMKVHEVSPVMVGAGVGTRLTSMKALTDATLEDHVNQVADENEELIGRFKALAALRQKDGRVLSRANRTRLSALLDQLNAVGVDITALLAATDPDRQNDDEAGKQRALRIRGRILMRQANA